MAGRHQSHRLWAQLQQQGPLAGSSSINYQASVASLGASGLSSRTASEGSAQPGSEGCSGAASWLLSEQRAPHALLAGQWQCSIQEALAPSTSSSASRVLSMPAPVGARGIKSKVTVEYHPMPEPASDTYVTEPQNYVQLLRALSAAPRVERLQQLVGNYRGKLDAVHVAAALTRLPKLASFRESDLVQGVVARIPEDPAQARTWSEERAAQSRGLPRPGARARSSYSAAASKVAGELLDALLSARGAAGSSSSRGGSGSGAGALLGPEWVRGRGRKGAAKKGHALVDSFYPRQVANTVWALGTLASMGVQLPAAKVVTAVERGLGALAAKNWAALAVHGEPADVAQLCKGLALLRAAGLAPTAHGAAAGRVLAAWAAEHAPRFSAREVSMALTGLVALGAAGAQPRAVDALAARAAQLPASFPPPAIAALLRALALAPVPRAGSASAATRAAALEAMAAGIAPQLVALQPQDLGALASALGKLGLAAGYGGVTTGSAGAGSRPLPPWLASVAGLLQDKALRDLGSLSPSQLGHVLHMGWALGAPHEALLCAVVRGVLRERALDPRLPVPAAASFMQALAHIVRGAVPAEPAGDEALAAQQQGQEQQQQRGKLSAAHAVEAVARVKSIYKAPEALAYMGPQDLIWLLQALGAVEDGDEQLVAAIAKQAEQLMLPGAGLGLDEEQQGEADVEGVSARAPFTAQQLHELLAGMRELGRGSVQLGAACARYLRDELAKPALEKGSAAAARAVLPHAVAVLGECGAVSALEGGAARNVGALYLLSTKGKGGAAKGSPAAASAGGADGGQEEVVGDTSQGLGGLLGTRQQLLPKQASAAASAPLDVEGLATLLHYAQASGALSEEVQVAAAQQLLADLASSTAAGSGAKPAAAAAAAGVPGSALARAASALAVQAAQAGGAAPAQVQQALGALQAALVPLLPHLQKDDLALARDARDALRRAAGSGSGSPALLSPAFSKAVDGVFLGARG